MIYHFADFDPSDDAALEAYAEWKAAQAAEDKAWELVETKMNELVEVKKAKDPKKKGASPEETQLLNEVKSLRNQALRARIDHETKRAEHAEKLLEKHPDQVMLLNLPQERAERALELSRQSAKTKVNLMRNLRTAIHREVPEDA